MFLSNYVSIQMSSNNFFFHSTAIEEVEPVDEGRFNTNNTQTFSPLNHSSKSVFVFVVQKMWLLFLTEIGVEPTAGTGKQEKMEQMTVKLSILLSFFSMPQPSDLVLYHAC